MLKSAAASGLSPGTTRARKLHPIVQVVQIAASELNDQLNAIGLRISLLRHELEASPWEAEMLRLAGLVEKASQRVQRLQEYARAEKLVASMRPAPVRKRLETSVTNGAAFLADREPRTALLISDGPIDDSSIKEVLERSGCTVVVAESSADGLKLLQSNDNFDHIVCDSSLLAETGGKFAAELSRAAPASRVYVLQGRHLSDRVADFTN
jgi:PleD family two-component response regulator